LSHLWQTAQDSQQISVWFLAIQLGCLDDTVERAARRGTRRRIHKQPTFAADNEGPNLAFNQVRIGTQEQVIDES